MEEGREGFNDENEEIDDDNKEEHTDIATKVEGENDK